MLYFVSNLMFMLWDTRNKFKNIMFNLKSVFSLTKIDILAVIVALIALFYVILPIVNKSFLIGDIWYHLVVTQSIYNEGKIVPYLSKYDIKLVYTTGLHATYAMLMFLTNKTFNILYLPFLIYGFYFIFVIMYFITMYLFTKSITASLFSSIITLFILPPAIGFHFFPAAHIFAFSFITLIFISIFLNRYYIAIFTSFSVILIHPVGGISQLIVSIIAAFVANMKNNSIIVISRILRTIKANILIVLFISLIVFGLIVHFWRVFYGSPGQLYYEKPAAYNIVLNRNKEILIRLLSDGYRVFNYRWYLRLKYLRISEIFIVLSMIYLVITILRKKYQYTLHIKFNNIIVITTYMWLLLMFSLLVLSVILRSYIIMPVSFNRVIPYSIILIVFSIWTLNVKSKDKVSSKCIYLILLLGVMGMNALPINFVENSITEYYNRVQAYTYDINTNVFKEISNIIKGDTTVIIQANAPIRGAMALLDAKRIIVLLDHDMCNDLESLPTLLLTNPAKAYTILRSLGIDYYIMYIPKNNDSWIVKYFSRLLFKDIKDPYKLYYKNIELIKQYFHIVYNKHNYIILKPLS